ncbi:hypothetical protein [Vallitalea okinawensis]|uniref:hypothetical protein n=1 Tax=Vallitalea okinawensis TaxID=2078660 RepID=UPI000CFC139E|nr:hypothetical protein [Vallitalea okinawensis]
MNEEQGTRKLNLKAISIFIIACIAAIIIGIFLISSNKMEEEEINSQSIVEQTEMLLASDQIMSTGSIYMEEMRVDYMIQKSEVKEKVIFEVFYQENFTYSMEYYEEEGQSFVYLPVEEKYVTLPYELKREGNFLDLAKMTLFPETEISVTEENEYTWIVSRDEFINQLSGAFDEELNQLLDDLADLVQGTDVELDNQEDTTNYLKEHVFTEEPIAFYIKADEKGASLMIETMTKFGAVVLKETTIPYDEEIEIISLPSERVPLDVYRYLR